jgi:hypothetical protein
MRDCALFKHLARSAVLPATLLALGLTISQPASAGAAAGGWTRSSQVTDMVTDNGGTWTYNYTVHNTSVEEPGGLDFEPFIVDWELPWFSDAGITSILSPAGWAHAIEDVGLANPSTGWGGVANWQDPGDPWYAGASSPFTTATQVLHWYRCGGEQPAARLAAVAVEDGCGENSGASIAPGGELSGFSFIADYDETAAPYQASWQFQPPRTGDPAFPLGGIPNSPMVSAVPEPGVVGLLGLGLLLLTTRRRKSS